MKKANMERNKPNTNNDLIINEKLFKKLSVMIDGRINATIIKQLKTLHSKDNVSFVKFCNEINDTHTKRIPQNDFIRILDQCGFLINDHYETIDAIARTTKMAKLAKFARVIALSSSFDKQLNIVTSTAKLLIANKENIANAAIALTNPVMGLTNIALQIFGHFMGSSGENFNKYLVQKLDFISSQISDLHEEMRIQFDYVHEHLYLLHTQLLHCSDGIDILIKNQANGFDSVNSNIHNIRNLIKNGVIDLMAQDLLNLCTKVNSRINNHSTINEKVEIQDIAQNLEKNWILNQSSLHSMTGKGLFIAGNSNAAHGIDNELLTPNSDNWGSILGYLVSLSKEMGLDLLQTADGIPTVNQNQIINVDIFNTAVDAYLLLRQQFVSYIQDDTEGSKLLAIETFANNTINFIRKIQRSKPLFQNLLLNYANAIQKVDVEIEKQVLKGNASFQQEIRTNEIALNLSYDELKTKFKGKIQGVAHAGYTSKDINNYPVPSAINLSGLSYKNKFDLPPEIAMAITFGFGSLQSSYQASVYYPDLSIQYPNAIIYYQDRKGDRHVGRMTDYGPLRFRDDRDGIIIQNNRGRLLRVHPSHYICCFSVHTTGTFLGKLLFTQTFNLSGSLDFRTYHNLIDIKVKMNEIANRLNYDSDTKCPQHNEIVNDIATAIKSTIVQQRKEKIVKPLLLKDNNPALTIAMQHLDSAKNRLLAFSSIAGMSVELNQAFSMLPSSTEVYDDLNAYLETTDMETPYWSRPSNESIKNVAEFCMQIIDNNNFSSEVQRKITAANSMIALTRTMHTIYVTNAKIMDKTPEQKAQELLGFGLADLESKFSENPAYRTLIKAIIESDLYRFIRVTQPTTGVKLNHCLNGDMILPIHLASYIGTLEIVDLFDKHLDMINTTTADGNTALMYAVLSGNIYVVKRLCEMGADVNIANREEKTAEQLANEYGLNDISEYLATLAQHAMRKGFKSKL